MHISNNIYDFFKKKQYLSKNIKNKFTFGSGVIKASIWGSTPGNGFSGFNALNSKH